MLRNLLRTKLGLWIGSCCSSSIHLRLLHSPTPKTLKPSISDITVSHLVKSSGLPKEAALPTYKDLCMKLTEKSGSFLALLSSHGFTRAQIVNIVTKCPVFLTYNPDKYIKPKLEFFLTAGLSNKDLTKLISANPYILRHGLEKTLMPNFNQLKCILGGTKEAAAALGGASSILCKNPEKDLLPNMKTLQEYGVPEKRIVKLTILYPRAFMQNPERFSRSVKLVKELGLDPSKVNFALGVIVVAGLSLSTWERKLQLYRSLEWSDDDAIVAFKRHPFCMLLSDDKIKKVMCFYVEKLKLEPSYVAARPKLLAFSFEKRVLPRYMVLSVLESKGLLRLGVGLVSCLLLSEKKFVLRYVAKYQELLPQVLEAYQAKHDLTNLREAQPSLDQHVVDVNGSSP